MSVLSGHVYSNASNISSLRSVRGATKLKQDSTVLARIIGEGKMLISKICLKNRRRSSKR